MRITATRWSNLPAAKVLLLRVLHDAVEHPPARVLTAHAPGLLEQAWPSPRRRRGILREKRGPAPPRASTVPVLTLRAASASTSSFDVGDTARPRTPSRASRLQAAMSPTVGTSA